MTEANLGSNAPRMKGSGSRRGLTWSMAPSLVGVVGGILYTIAARELNVGTLAKPGPGLFPLFVSVVVTVPSAICLVTEYLRPSKPPEGLGPFFWRVPALALGLLLYIFLLKPAGFVVAAALLCATQLWAFGRRPWWVVGLLALAASLCCYLIFLQLNVPMPSGIMPF
ncbi:MAG: tripartite tricarboxylate transporter TctB family protein [Chloroflexota bacterium]